MKKVSLLSILSVSLTFLQVFLWTACPSGGGGGGGGGVVTNAAMVTMPAGTVSTTTGSAVFIANRTSVQNIDAFKIAAYETTWSLWKEVYDWATANGYAFENAGVEGHGTTGTGAAAAANRTLRPVTTISWRDAIVWCNAYSQKSGKEPVYYKEAEWTTILKDSRNTNAADVDAAKVKTSANGYRLPTEAEWEYAARGGDQNDAQWNYTYSGSGTIGDVAWYEVNSYDLTSSDPAYGAHPVGTKAANRKGIFDMSGNVWEWCWDRYGTISSSTPATGAASGADRVIRGGGWDDSGASSCEVAYRNGFNPDGANGAFGFRVVCP
ncbi:hypothetical protein FACS189494_08670 [Spirochaetia bacterium]|nr:hypothetical protein FACS189494_08670 [Spirochaetia bacterium]